MRGNPPLHWAAARNVRRSSSGRRRGPGQEPFTLLGLMKALSSTIGFGVGVAVTAVACSVLDSAREGRRQVQLLSDVHDPLRQCLDDIAQTYDRGDTTLAERKARLLRKSWSEYLRSGGRAPEQFSNEIMQLGDAGTRPAH